MTWTESRDESASATRDLLRHGCVRQGGGLEPLTPRLQGRSSTLAVVP